MPVTADKLDAMLAAGLTREQMAALLKAEVAAEDAARAERRARAAAKKRRQRAEIALERFADVPGTLGDNEGHEGTNGDEAGQPGTEGDAEADPAKEALTTQENTTKQQDTPSAPKGASPQGADRRRGHRIPDGFEHSDEARQIARDLGFFGSEADEPLAEFGDYWRALPGVRGTKLDWPATLRNRLREVARRRGRQNGRAPPSNGRPNPFFDLARDPDGGHDDRPGYHDRPKLIAGARH